MKQFFRYIPHDKPSTCIQNIDHIYLLNLDQRPRKLSRSLELLSPYSIEPQRVSAVYGWELPRQVVEGMALTFRPGMDGGADKKLKPVFYPHATSMQALDSNHYGKPCFYPRTSLGAFGCALSHLSILQNAYDRGYETIWVLEDDFGVAQDPHALSSFIDLLDTLEPDWDLLYTDDRNYFDVPFTPGTVWRPDRPSMDTTPFLRREVGREFVQISGRSQMHSVILRRSGIKKILDFEITRGLFLPYDIDIAFIPDIKLFNIRHEIVWGGVWSAEISDTDFRHF